MSDKPNTTLKADDDKVDVADDGDDLGSEHGVEEPLHQASKHSSSTELNKDGTKKKNKKSGDFIVNVSLPYFSLRVGTIQFFLGIFLLLFGIAAVATNAGTTKYTFGIWIGVAGTSAGVLGVLLAQMRRRDLLLACIIVSISAIILAVVTVIAGCIGIKEDVEKKSGQELRKNFLVDAYINYNAPIALNSILIILSVLEAFVASVNVAFCSMFIRMVLKENPQVVYQEQTAPITKTAPTTKTSDDAVSVHRGCGCTVYLSYNGAVGLRCGIIQLTLGILLLAFGIVNLALKGWGSDFAIAVWGSAFIITAGCLGIHSATDKRRDILIACCFFSAISCAAVTGLFITAAVATHYDFPMLPAEKVVVHIILMVFALAEFIVGVFQATFCGKAFPAHESNQHHCGRPQQPADCSMSCSSGRPISSAVIPQSSPMVILPLPGRSKEPFHINYGQASTGGFFVSVNERVPYIDDDVEVIDTAVHYSGKEASRKGANV